MTKKSEANKTNEILDELFKYKFDEDEKISPEVAVFKINDRIVGSLGNFICFAGLPKAGKSTFVNACIASALGKDNILGFSFDFSKLKNKKIAFFDTENSKYNLYKNVLRIKSFMTPFETKHVRFNNTIDIFRLRNCRPDAIRMYIETYIKETGCKIIFVDGFLDLINNFNDELESRSVIDWFKYITDIHECLIIGVIHTGKSTSNTIGHFGSMIDRYAESVIEVLKNRDRGTLDLNSKLMRSDKDFESISIISREDGRYYQITIPPEETSKKTRGSK